MVGLRSPMNIRPDRKTRIGKFGFLNNFLPYYFLEKSKKYEIVETNPRNMVNMLLRKQIHYAPVPLFASLKNGLKNYSFCVASNDRVLSVVVVSKKKELEGDIAITNQSLTSVNLLKIILKEKGLENRLREFDSGSAWDLLKECDNALVIGDEAIKARMVFRVVMDLGEEWYDITGLPMVFGISASLNGFDASKIDRDLLESTEKGYKNIHLIIEEAEKHFKMPVEFLEEYFKTLKFKLGGKERRSIELFEEYCRKYDLI
ncbi:futalosine synthase [Archaeoglobus sulfaticallidus PM70-1]|uniref:Chorismate dehydratase n=1 Tax=Archaeoglobus sulfaticallidus PM70-1 TaxID=387631 RepID=N0BI97_9EURY|nr:menaquinone biosynthesis protein [Archaeoglobus sulfaticallidus]AGK60186.1 futalosine synthase [Archaeoglobus sulfaticallidus PM70-1]